MRTLGRFRTVGYGYRNCNVWLERARWHGNRNFTMPGETNRALARNGPKAPAKGPRRSRLSFRLSGSGYDSHYEKGARLFVQDVKQES